MSHVLISNSPHVCAVDGSPAFGRGLGSCAKCTRKDEVSGCDLRRQGPYLYGWSDSNVQYERIGMAPRE
jgi:hypothetical protein